MNSHEPIGYLASALVLTTFCMRRMVVLRAVAIASNLAFISYGALAEIDPVLLLHALLLPTNIYRLMQAIHDERSSKTVDTSVQFAAPRFQAGWCPASWRGLISRAQRGPLKANRTPPGGFDASRPRIQSR
jgi:hypothetical protein